MHPREVVDEARRLHATGLTVADVAHRLGLPWRTVAHWCRGDRRSAGGSACLEEWQRRIVDTHFGPFLRGLFHSDGCRLTNRTQRRVAGELRRYEYPRYFFSNKSLDILGLCCASLDRLGVAYRRPYRDQVSVARREAVAALDAWVGAKT